MCRASNMVISCPSLTRSAATVKPAGPAPITATFLPVGSAFGGITAPFSRSQSARKRSRRPMLTGSPILPMTHLLWHCTSCGQTLPQTAGRAFLVLMAAMPSAYFFSLMHLMNVGIGTSTGQPVRHIGFGQQRHLAASSCASASV